MKNALLISMIVFSSISFSQEAVQFSIGGEAVEFEAYVLFPNNGGEATYYNITDGVLDYYTVVEYNGVVIEYKHYFCPTDVIDTKTLEFREYDAGGMFMYLSAKNLEANINYESFSYSDSNLKKIEDTSKSIMLIVPDKEIGTRISGEIKKGKLTK